MDRAGQKSHLWRSKKATHDEMECTMCVGLECTIYDGLECTTAE